MINSNIVISDVRHFQTICEHTNNRSPSFVLWQYQTVWLGSPLAKGTVDVIMAVFIRPILRVFMSMFSYGCIIHSYSIIVFNHLNTNFALCLKLNTIEFYFKYTTLFTFPNSMWIWKQRPIAKLNKTSIKNKKTQCWSRWDTLYCLHSSETSLHYSQMLLERE